MPGEYGGAGLGVTGRQASMATIAGSGGAMAVQRVHMNIFGPHAIVKHGSDDQKARWLPGLIDGTYKMRRYRARARHARIKTHTATTI